MRRHVVLAVLMLVGATANAGAQKLADEQSRRQALEFYRTGQEFMSSERFDKAAEAFTAAIEKDQLLTVAHYQLGQAHMSLKQFASAIQAYKGCLQAMETLHHLEQSSKFEVDKQREQEIRELRSEMDSLNQIKTLGPLKRAVIEQRLQDLQLQRTSSIGGPFRPPAFVMLALGSAHFRSGDRAAAAAEWQAAVDANPKLGEAHNNLAALYLMSQKLDDAEKELELAEKAGYHVHPRLKDDIKNARKSSSAH
jgi:tetratricopeptide (TPR) repeat protein